MTTDLSHDGLNIHDAVATAAPTPTPKLYPGETLAASSNLDEPMVIPLPQPIAWQGGTITQLVISEPTAGQMEMWSGMVGVTADVKAVSVVAGVHEDVVRKLPARVFVRASKRIADFLD